MSSSVPEKDGAPAGSAASEYPDTCGIPPDFLQMLVCPLGKADLRLENSQLIWTRCGAAFRIEDGIPILLIEEARLPPGVQKIEDLACFKQDSAKR